MNKKTKAVLSLSSAMLVCLALSGCDNSNSNQPSNSGSSNTSTTTTSTSTSSTSSPGAGKTVIIGYVDWPEDVATSYLWQNLLQSKGYKVEMKMLDAGPLFAGLSEGGLNVFFDTWLPTTHAVYMKKYGANLTDLGKWYEGTTNEGFVVPQYVTNVNTIQQLKANASEFGNQIVGIDAGAGEMGLAAKAIKVYGLPMKLIASSSPAMVAALEKAYAAKKPIVVTLWSPNWVFSKYKLKYVTDPKLIFGASGWIQTEANKAWAAKNPTVSGWIQNFKLTPDQLGALEEDINSSSTPAEGVSTWLSNSANEAAAMSWLK
ncbi:MAG: glycine betaine ABC transporter substrate-binding protein [Alicyclobacillaceae bacterium]|jgi:glycine betaine/proline transport system substrate-binding protein|uniref:glycine betaine ABC transporter substrate-binding protein n=1 Tax=Alicyclobacillus sp. SP_1 TaxID=2942475 RepID=UPI0021577232|nr:glycine betaine ABC transporter substrate-binding protein [Alicyclobacillus sp. SP_1]MCY0887034.1 glycine betaine ABC transporter substrate-binding protein [Alicyclobacillaceae bacterium]MCY0896048.1 glycine betaine ABC transporter substrate-binding protein [Alicyclobacillaceae bacterium]